VATGLSLALTLLAAGAAAEPHTTEPLELTTAGRCAGATPSDKPDEIVVCGSRETRSPYRLPEISPRYERAPLRAERQIAPGAVASLNVQSVNMPGGLKSDRVMITLTVKR
jgi:hypothetical protein